MGIENLYRCSKPLHTPSLTVYPKRAVELLFKPLWANTESWLWKWWSMWQQGWGGCSQRLLTSNNLLVCTYCLHKTNLTRCAWWKSRYSPSHTLLNLSLKRHSLLNLMNQSVLWWRSQRLSLFSLRAEEPHCAPEHRELLSAAKLPSDIASAVTKANICPPLTFLQQYVPPKTYTAASGCSLISAL